MNESNGYNCSQSAEENLLALAIELEIAGRMQSSVMLGGSRAERAGAAIRSLIHSSERYADKRTSFISPSAEIGVHLEKIERMLEQQDMRLRQIETKLSSHEAR
jgi:hypothetical protein